MASTGAVTVMGAGAWGTVLAKVLADAGGDVTLWARRADVAKQINATRYNPDYLPGTQLPAGIRATADAEEALSGATTVLLGVPAQTMRTNLEHWNGMWTDGATLVNRLRRISHGHRDSIKGHVQFLCHDLRQRCSCARANINFAGEHRNASVLRLIRYGRCKIRLAVRGGRRRLQPDRA